MKKLKSLLHKKRNVRVFVWKGIRKNTPLSSKIFGYVKSTNCWLKRNRKKNVRFFEGEVKNVLVNEERCICCLSTKAEDFQVQ